MVLPPGSTLIDAVNAVKQRVEGPGYYEFAVVVGGEVVVEFEVTLRRDTSSLIVRLVSRNWALQDPYVGPVLRALNTSTRSLGIGNIRIKVVLDGSGAEFLAPGIASLALYSVVANEPENLFSAFTRFADALASATKRMYPVPQIVKRLNADLDNLDLLVDLSNHVGPVLWLLDTLVGSKALTCRTSPSIAIEITVHGGKVRIGMYLVDREGRERHSAVATEATPEAYTRLLSELLLGLRALRCRLSSALHN